jgi:hypothetical protein
VSGDATDLERGERREDERERERKKELEREREREREREERRRREREVERDDPGALPGEPGDVPWERRSS